jgi:putative FmdB family regulatory protein
LPIYEYQCARGHRYEQTEGFDAPAEQTCPTCGSHSRRQLSLPAVIFKGPGFYSTDNRKGFASGGGNGSRSPVSSDGGSEKSEGESKGESDSESKAEATAD